MNAIALLEKQHKKVEQILKRLQNAKSGQEELIVELATNLTAHARIEEEIFYPAARKLLKGKDSIINEAYEEHAVVILELERALKSSRTDAMFKARVKVIKDLVMHHVEEEEQEILPRVEKMMDEESLDDLGARMKERFDEVVEEGYEQALVEEKKIGAVRATRSSRGNGTAARR